MRPIGLGDRSISGSLKIMFFEGFVVDQFQVLCIAVMVLDATQSMSRLVVGELFEGFANNEFEILYVV